MALPHEGGAFGRIRNVERSNLRDVRGTSEDLKQRQVPAAQTEAPQDLVFIGTMIVDLLLMVGADRHMLADQGQKGERIPVEVLSLVYEEEIKEGRGLALPQGTQHLIP